jgi:hypothetical protein
VASNEGFRFLKDPLFLASSVYVNKPERIRALSLIMVVCFLVSRLAECRLRARFAETAYTLSDPLQTPPAHPTMRWVFPCFEGIEVLPLYSSSSSRTLVFRLHATNTSLFPPVATAECGLGYPVFRIRSPVLSSSSSWKPSPNQRSLKTLTGGDHKEAVIRPSKRSKEAGGKDDGEEKKIGKDVSILSTMIRF